MESDGGREDGWRVWRLQEIAFDGVVGQPKAAAQGAEWVPAKDHHVFGEDQSCRGIVRVTLQQGHSYSQRYSGSAS